MNDFSNQAGRALVEAMIAAIQANADLLSQIDGAIGDGDHGINMRKGFSLCAERLAGRDWNLAEGLSVLGDVLLEEIGGAMGPLYGSCFREMAQVAQGKERIDQGVFGAMLQRSAAAVMELGGAQVGDKTLIDTLVPAIEAFETAIDDGETFAMALDRLAAAAERGKDSTKDMISRIGRSSRLGERSRGVLDAGSVSCWLLLAAMAGAAQDLMAA